MDNHKDWLAEQAGIALRKNQAAFEKPYFGRIDYVEYPAEKEYCIYIGKNGIFENKTDVLIADWRAPISSVYYENELGLGSYGLTDEEPIQIDLTDLKRLWECLHLNMQVSNIYPIEKDKRASAHLSFLNTFYITPSSTHFSTYSANNAFGQVNHSLVNCFGSST